MTAPFWALDAPDPDGGVCWHDVYDTSRDLWDACNQPAAPGSTLCARHRRLLADTVAGVR